jgi:hypothetical protein
MLVIWQAFVQVAAEILPDAEPVGGEVHKVAFGADAFKEHHQLELEKDDRIDAGRPAAA